MARCVAALSVMGSVAFALPAEAGPGSCDTRVNNNHQKLLECVTLEGVREHQQALQDIADANGGTRASGTPGYEESVDYVVERMTAAGYNVTTVEFPFVFVPPPTLQQLTPVQADVCDGAFTGSFSGDVTAAVVPIDINLVPPRANTSGCDGAFTEAAVGARSSDPDRSRRFRRLPGGCDRPHPARRLQLRPEGHNAEAAGAGAVIIFNQGDTPAR